MIYLHYHPLRHIIPYNQLIDLVYRLGRRSDCVHDDDEPRRESCFSCRKCILGRRDCHSDVGGRKCILGRRDCHSDAGESLDARRPRRWKLVVSHDCVGTTTNGGAEAGGKALQRSTRTGHRPEQRADKLARSGSEMSLKVRGSQAAGSARMIVGASICETAECVRPNVARCFVASP